MIYRLITSFLLLFNITAAFSQMRMYFGTIGKYPISMVTYSYSDNDTRAIYVYEHFDTPINIDGKYSNGTLSLYERDAKGKITAVMEFEKYKPDHTRLTGQWISKEKENKLPIALTLSLQFDSYDPVSFEQKELLQRESTDSHYFKLLLRKPAGEEARVTGVKIYEKKSDRLIQEIALDCQLWGLDNVTVGDYNFDGVKDFSVFESSYAGPNTSSIYILRKINSEKYMVSDFTGTSLEFDEASRLIYEHNQCCAGRSHMNATYKVVNNKMVLVEKKCLEYDEKTEDFVEKKCD